MELLKNDEQFFDILPNETIINILIFIDADTLLDCRPVCKRWKELIDAYLFQEKAARENEFMNNGRGYNSFSEINSNDIRKLDLPWYVFYVIIKYDPFNRNLVKNHCGQDEWNHWTKINNMIWNMDRNHELLYNLSTIQQIPQEEQSILSDLDFDGHTSCFKIDFQHLRAISQKIIFKDYGLSEIVIKTLKPKIVFSAWYYRTYIQTTIYKLRAAIYNKSNRIIKVCENCNTGLQQMEFEWNKVSQSFETEGDESYLVIDHSIFDFGYSRLTYSFKMSCSVVKILLPIKYKNVNS